MHRFAALIFDVDGTLAETEETHRRAFNETFAYFNLDWNWSPLLYRQLLVVTGGKERLRFFANSRRNMGRALSDDEIAALHRFKTARFGQLVAGRACPLRPGVAAAISAAAHRGQRLAIATTTSRPNIEALLSATLGRDALDLFDAIVAGDEVPRKKPASDVYLKALDLLGLPAGDCLAIEDSRNGLLSASAAGIPVLITRSAYFRDDDVSGALAVVDSLEDLKDFALFDR